jgi:hypothetical protein
MDHPRSPAGASGFRSGPQTIWQHHADGAFAAPYSGELTNS